MQVRNDRRQAIHKETLLRPPNLADYDDEVASFSWDAAATWAAGLPGGGLNIAYEVIDRHVIAGRGESEALRFLRRDRPPASLTYQDLLSASSRMADLLGRLGVQPGDRVFGLLGRIPELYLTALGTLRAGAVFCPLFSSFGPEPVRERLVRGDARVVVTTPSLYRRKLADIRDQVPSLRHVLVVAPEADTAPETLSLTALLADAQPGGPVARTGPEDMALLHFTSGTTGSPKAAVHVHQAIVGHYTTARYALDLQPDDIFWCTADPGWVTGTSYGILAPLAHGITSIVDEEEFDARRWYGLLEQQQVSVWYTAPTALRMLRKAGDELARQYDLSRLRYIASVGEPLNPEIVLWANDVLGLPVHDNWWQTETGGIMIANFPSLDIRPGSMGKPLPGIDARLIARDARGDPCVRDGEPVFVDQPDEPGVLALRSGWPSMFRGYLHDETRYRKSFLSEWYVSGDLARRDADGYFWFVGRGDDVIKSAGHLIGPFEVESALMEHPAVVGAGVIGVPDPVAGEVVKAFVELRDPYRPSDELRVELLAFGRKRLGPAVAPRSLTFTTDLPRTRSGKIMRRLLKARELGLEEGDVSTLEPPS